MELALHAAALPVNAAHARCASACPCPVALQS